MSFDWLVFYLGQCRYCDSGKFSDGSTRCQLCPIHTEARRSLTFRRFDVLPDRMTTGCIEISDSKLHSPARCSAQCPARCPADRTVDVASLPLFVLQSQDSVTSR